MPQTIILSYAILTCSILSATIGYLLWSKQHTNRYANRLLALLLFAYAYINFVTSLINDGLILDVPHFFRTAAPLNYLIGPLIYLYVRASLLSVSRFDYQHGWLFLPAAFHIAELLPFYTRNGADKVEHLKTLVSEPNSLVNITEGWLPAAVHLVGYTLSSLVYSLLAGWLLWTYLKQEKSTPYRNAVYDNWIKLFVLIHVVFNLVWAVDIVFLQQTAYASLSLNIIRVAGQLIICFYVIQRPTLLYGAYWLEKSSAGVLPTGGSAALILPKTMLKDAEPVSPPQAVDNSTDVKPVTADEPDIRGKLEILEQYMIVQQPYLQPRLSLANVSVAINIPPYLLSAMVNRVVGLDFRDYVNAHRVRYLCHMLESKRYNHLTLEGIGMEAGFSSKTTFYRAFQKHTGLTPAQYSSLNSQPDAQ